MPEQGQGREIPTSNTNRCARPPQTPHEANSGTSLATSRTPQHLLHSKRKTCRNAPTAGQAATPNSRTPGHFAAHPARSLGPPGHPPTPPTDPPLALTCFVRSGALLAAAALAPMPVAAKPSPPVAGPSTCREAASIASCTYGHGGARTAPGMLREKRDVPERTTEEAPASSDRQGAMGTKPVFKP